MDKYKKNEKYKDLMEKLNKSIKNEFFYEAIFIEYAILEDRTESLLRHAKINEKNSTITLKINKIKTNKIFKDKYINKHLSIELLDKIIKWKNKRNELIHDLIKTKYTNNQIESIALEGYEIVKKVNNKSTLVNKYLDKINNLIQIHWFYKI